MTAANHLPSATQHLEKAVALYDKYAAAWNELGQIHAANHETEKARQAFEKAIAVDGQYIPPYVSLAALELQTEQYDSAAETAGKALGLDPTIGSASYIQAAADFKLNRLDEAEKSAREAENEPHQNIPQVHVLLADIFLQKQDYGNAATQLRAYLKESPHGSFADEAKKSLEEIEKTAGDAGDKSGARWNSRRARHKASTFSAQVSPVSYWLRWPRCAPIFFTSTSRLNV